MTMVGRADPDADMSFHGGPRSLRFSLLHCSLHAPSTQYTHAVSHCIACVYYLLRNCAPRPEAQ